VAGDRHLHLLWSEDPQDVDDQSEEDEDFIAELAPSENQGIRRVERLGGNITGRTTASRNR